MSIESRLKRGDNPDDVRRLFPQKGAEIDQILAEIKPKVVKKKAVRKTKA
jgi:hypothetical protein